MTHVEVRTTQTDTLILDISFVCATGNFFYVTCVNDADNPSHITCKGCNIYAKCSAKSG